MYVASQKQTIIEDIERLRDFNQLSKSDLILKSKEVQDYFRDLELRAEPEACIIKVFQNIFQNVDLTHQIAAGGGNADFLVHTPDKGTFILEFKKYIEYNDKKRRFETWHLNPYINTYEMTKIRKQVFQYLNDSGSSSEYLILTNLQYWYFYGRSNVTSERKLKPFAVKSLSQVYQYFSEGFTIRDLRRLELEEGKRDLSEEFFSDLTSWIEILRKVKFKEQVNSAIQLENIVFILNKFIFVRTLDAYGISPVDVLGSWWRELDLLYPTREREFLKEYFKRIDELFHLYYDTELFSDNWYDRIFDSVLDNMNNWTVFKNSLIEVLGVNSKEYGIRNYKFEQIDEDIFGGTYERFLAEQRNERKDKGIYYTPTYVTDYIVSKTLDPQLKNLFEKIKEETTKENIDFQTLTKLKEQVFNLSICDIACGSGSFLIQAIEHFWNHFLDLQDHLNFLRENEKNKTIAENEGSSSLGYFIYKNLDKCIELFMLEDKRRLLAYIVMQCIHGIDLDARAIDVAKLNIWLKIISLSPDDFKYYNIPSDTKHILPNLQLNLFVGDSLISLPNDDITKFLDEFRGDLGQISSERYSYLENYQQLTPDDILLKIEKIGNQLSSKFESFLTGKSIDAPILQSLKPCYYPLFFWYNYFNLDRDEEKGFDIIIGNPPYGNYRLQLIEKIMDSNYSSYVDNYAIFLERALQLLKKDGKVGFIVPVSWQTGNKYIEFRNKFVMKNKLDYVVNLPFDVFKDAYVDTCIVISSNIPPKTTGDRFSVFQYKKKDKIRDIDEKVIQYDSIDYLNVLQDPLKGVYMKEIFYILPHTLSKFKSLGEITRSTRGIEAYRYKILDYLPAEGSKWRSYQEFSGNSEGNVYRYQIDLANSKYVNIENDINRKSQEGYFYLEFFKGNRLLIRRIVNRSNEIMGMIVSDDFVVKKDMYCFKLMDTHYQLKYLLAIINSRLIHYLLLGRSSTATKDDFRQITLDELRSIRVFPAHLGMQKEIEVLVDKIIRLQKKLKAANVSIKLEHYYDTPTSHITVRSYLEWPNKKNPSEKELLLTKNLECNIEKIQVYQQDDWMTFCITGTQLVANHSDAQNRRMPIVDKPIFRVKELDDRLREFLVYHLRGIKIPKTQTKKIHDIILDLKIPEFYTNRKNNIQEIIKTVESYRKGSNLYHDLKKQIEEIDAEIDAKIFKLYDVSANDAELFLSSLDAEPDFIRAVIDKVKVKNSN